MSQHHVDTDQLDALNAQLRNLLGFTEDALMQVQQRMNRLHDGDGATEPWTGETAEAARTAMDTWTRGAQKVRDGLSKMEQAGKTAHDSYVEGIAAVLDRVGYPSSGVNEGGTR